MYYIINILLITLVLLIFKNYKKGLTLFLILTPIINNPALNVVNVKYLPLMTLWRFTYIFILIKYFSLSYFRKIFFNNDTPFINNLIIITIALLFSSLANGFVGISSIISTIIEEILLFVVIWNSFDDKEKIISVFKGLLIIFFIVTLYGVYCRITNSNPFHTEILDKINTSGYRQIQYGEYENRIRAGINQRVASLFYNPISYGAHLGMIFPFLMLFSKFSKSKLKLFIKLLIILVLVNIFIVNSRSAIVMLFFSLFIYYCFQNVSIKIRFLFLFFIIIVISLFYPEIYGPYLVNIRSIINLSSEYSEVGGTTLYGRLEMYNSFINFIENKPLFGYGPDSLNRFLSLGYKYTRSLGAENYSLSLIFNYGLFCFAAYLLFWFNIYNKFKNIRKYSNDVFQKEFSIAGTTILLTWLLFVNITGGLNTTIFLTILVTLSLKYCSLFEGNLYQGRKND